MFTRDEYEERRQRLLAEMEREGLDVLIAFSSKLEGGHVRYFTGYESQLGILDCSFLVVSPGFGQEWILVTNAFWDAPFGIAGMQETVVTSDFAQAICKLVPVRTREVGIAGYRYFPTPVYRAIAEERKPRAIRDATGLVLRVRAIKSPAEIEVLKRIAAISDTAAEALVRASQPGVSEREIANEIESALRLAGS